METRKKTVIVLNGFFKWFFCGCEAKKVYIYKSQEKVEEKRVPKYDDLTVIEGIGPVIKSLLNKYDIYSFEDLARTKVEDLRMILDDNQLQYHEPTTWPKQAELAANGEWERLQIWQDELDGGREK